MKRVYLIPVLCLALCGILITPGFGVSLEQIQSEPPIIDVYVYGDGADISQITAADVSATLGGEPVKCDFAGRSEQGILYVFMLDVSGSIPTAHFRAATDAIIRAAGNLRPQDSLKVIAFGSTVSLALSGDETSQEIEDVLGSLAPVDNETLLYSAMDMLIDTVSGSSDMRRVAVVISDGVDDTDAEYTLDRLEENLKNCGIAVYALCIDSVGQDSVDGFSEFIDLSGGELYTFGPDDADEKLGGLLEYLSYGLHLRFQIPPDFAGGSELPLEIDFGGVDRLSATVSLAAVPTPAALEEPAVTEASPLPEVSEAPENEAGEAAISPYLIAGIAALVIIVLAGILLAIRKRRRERDGKSGRTRFIFKNASDEDKKHE